MKWKFVMPKGSKPDAADRLRKEVEQMKEVAEARLKRPRSAGAEVMLWVSVAANVVGIATAGVHLFERVRGAVKKQKLEGVHIELPDGVRISVDKASPQEVERLVTALEDRE